MANVSSCSNILIETGFLTNKNQFCVNPIKTSNNGTIFIKKKHSITIFKHDRQKVSENQLAYKTLTQYINQKWDDAENKIQIILTIVHKQQI